MPRATRSARRVLCKAVGCNTEISVCKNKLGKNASKVIDSVVVNRAKELLMQPGVSIQEVSERLNFVSQSFFGKYFKQRTGVSPSRYKVQN